MMDAILRNENIPIGAALLAMVWILTKYMTSKDHRHDERLAQALEQHQEVARDATTAIKDNTAVCGRLQATLESMDRTMKGAK